MEKNPNLNPVESPPELPEELLEIFGSDPLEMLTEDEDGVNLQYFRSFMDWLTLLMFVGGKHALSTLEDNEITDLLEIIGRRMGNPSFKNRWRWARDWVERVGVKQAIGQIMLELRRTLQGDKA